MIIPVYWAGFTVEINLGELCVRTSERFYQPAFAFQVHLLGYRPVTGSKVRNRWAFIQFGERTFWLRRY